MSATPRHQRTGGIEPSGGGWFVPQEIWGFGLVRSKAGGTVNNEDPKSYPSVSRRWEEGRYANFFQIGHNAFEFLLEFGQQDGADGVIHTRIYVSPQHARMLANLMLETLQQHERIFGKILNLVPKEPE
jgi:Protein of unknown function (DUF3467)